MQGAKVEFDEAFVYSLNNGNTRFQILLLDEFDPAESARPSTSGMAGEFVLEELRIPVLGGGRSGDSLHFSLEVDRATAQRAARTLEVVIQERAHPGHELSASFEVVHPIASGDEQIPVLFRIHNRGATVQLFDGGRNRNRLGRDNRFQFQVEQAGAPVAVLELPDFGGLAGYHTLAGGESYEIALDLANWIHLDEPGQYTVSGAYELLLLPGDFDHSAFRFGEHSHLWWDDSLEASFELVVE